MYLYERLLYWELTEALIEIFKQIIFSINAFSRTKDYENKYKMGTIIVVTINLYMTFRN